MKVKKIISLILTVALLFCFTACGNGSNLTSYNLEIEYENDMILVKEECDYVNNSPFTLTEIKFNMYGNAYRENAKFPALSPDKIFAAYGGNQSYGFIDVESVLLNGESVDFTIGGADLNVLTIPLSTPLKEGQTAQITITFKVKLAHVKHRLGIFDNVVMLGNFYPIACVLDKDGNFYECAYYNIGDPFYSDVANYEVSVKVPSEYTISSSGTATNVLTGGAYTTYSYVLKNARDFALTLSKDYKILSGKVGDVVLNYYYIDDLDPSYSFKIASDCLNTYSKLFGDYPYDCLSISEVPFILGGMEYPGLCYISNNLTAEQKAEVISHEIAHEWWYAVVGVNEIENGYIDEGLAQISSALFFENNPGYGSSLKEHLNKARLSYDGFKEIYKIAKKDLLEVIDRPLYEFNTEFEYSYLTYVLTEVIFGEVIDMVGIEDFTKTLKHVYSTYKFQNITKEQFLDAFKKCCKMDVSGYIASSLSGLTK